MTYNILGYRMHSPQYTQKDIDKFLKKSIKNDFNDPLSLPMAENYSYTKKDILNTVLFAVTEDTYVEYAAEHLLKKRMMSPPVMLCSTSEQAYQ
jgi:hypothetical protein